LSVTLRRRLAPLYASLPRRRLEVDIGAVPALEERYEIALPSGYEVRSLPPDAKGTSPFGSYSVEARQDAGKVSVTSRLVLAVSRVRPEQYPEFRAFCLAADAAFEARLALGAQGR
jgi:cellulose synthase operon protein C